MQSVVGWRLSTRLTSMMAAALLAACGGEQPAEVAPASIGAAVAEPAMEEPVDPDAVQPDASIEAVVVDADGATTVAGEEGRIPTPEAPVIEVVAYEDLAYVVGERVIIATKLGSVREGVLKRYFNTGLKVLVNERGREIELDMPRSTITEVKVVWTHAQGTAAP